MSSVYVLSTALRISIDALFNAHAALIVFFVLSGYVLTGSLTRRGLSLSSVVGFYTARLFRLFPALWAASAVSAGFLLIYPGRPMHPPASLWFFLYLHTFPAGPKLFLAALAIDKSLIMPVWTIFIELVGSAMMPLLAGLALTRMRIFGWIVVMLGLVSYLLAHAPHRLDSLAYMFDFALGVLLASREWKVFVDRLSLKLFGAAFTLIFFRFLWFAALNGHPIPLYDGYGAPLPMLVEGAAAFFLVGTLASERGRIQLLRSRGAIWLGNVSYSLYLIHFPVVILVAKIASRFFTDQTRTTIATGVLMAFAIPVSLLLASFLYRYVEIPAIAMGKRVSRRLVSNPTPLGV